MYLRNSQASRVLPMPPADDRDESDALLASRGVEEVLQQAELLVAADERRLESARCDRRHLRRRRRARPQAATGCGLALERLLAGGLEDDRARCGALRRLADEHGPGRRDGLQAGGRVDQVAGDHPLADGADVTAASPVRTPARASIPAASRWTASTSSRPARTARSASSSWATGAPQTAMTASPMNFSTVPP